MKTSVIVLAMLVSPFAGLAQTPTQPTRACADRAHRALDFWVGEWVGEWERQGKRGSSTNVVTRGEFGDCVIIERFRNDNGSFKGMSIAMYRPVEKQWRQTWMDEQGSYFDFVGGPVADGDHAFVFENKRTSQTSPYQRMVFQDVKADSFIWRWQNRTSADESWADSWVIHYRRKSTGAAR